MIKRLKNIEANFTLQGVIISGLLGVISCLLGFIFIFVFKLYTNSVDLNSNVAALTVKVDFQSQIQTALLENQKGQNEKIAILQYTDNHIFDEIDTIIISLADLKSGYTNHEGRLIILEERHE